MVYPVNNFSKVDNVILLHEKVVARQCHRKTIATISTVQGSPQVLHEGNIVAVVGSAAVTLRGNRIFPNFV